MDGKNTFSEIIDTFNNISPGATLIAVIGLSILILWDNVLSKKGKFFKLVQGPLVAVVTGIVFYMLTKDSEILGIASDHLVSVPVPEDASSFLAQFSFPNFGEIGNPEIWITAFTIALVASLETLLCVEATDRLDPGNSNTIIFVLMTTKMKIFARTLMLSIWLFGILMPSVVTLSGDDSVIVINLNEEEQQEGTKKIQAEEDIINDKPYNFSSLMAQSKTWTAGTHNSLGPNDFNLEILLPPPEREN